jgi:hypothetical protein
VAAGGVAGRRCSYGDAADRQRDRANGGLRGALICFLSFSRAPLADWDYEVEVDVGPRRRARYGVIIIGGGGEAVCPLCDSGGSRAPSLFLAIAFIKSRGFRYSSHVMMT